MKDIYVCAPLRAWRNGSPDWQALAANIGRAEGYANHVYSTFGEWPVIPHQIARWLNPYDQREDEVGRLQALALLDDCDELWVFGSDITTGMKAEIEYAQTHGKPVRGMFDEAGHYLEGGIFPAVLEGDGKFYLVIAGGADA